MSIRQLARPELLDRAGYTAALGRFDLTRLHANEMPNLQDGDDDGWNRYPPPRPIALTERLAELLELPTESLLVTRGSNEGIDLLVRAFCRSGVDAIITCPPTFGMYEICAEVQGASVLRVNLDSQFDLDVDGIVSAVTESNGCAKLVFICSPANPTGAHLQLSKIEQLCSSLAGKAVVVMDQAYIEFSDDHAYLDLHQRFDNLVILRTFSKAHGLAGLRCGFVVANPELIALLDSLLAPYSTPTPTIDGVLQALSSENLTRTNDRIAEIARQKTDLISFLQNSELVSQIFPSDSNFVLIKSSRAKDIYNHVLDRGILIRSFISHPQLANCLRITVGNKQENASLKKAFEELHDDT